MQPVCNPPSTQRVARLRVTDHAEGVSRQSSAPPGLELPAGYKWSWWWDTRRGCALLLSIFGAASLVLWAVTRVTSGWVEAASGLLSLFAAMIALTAFLGFVLPTKRGWFWD
jgi:hypothetical protein